MKGKMAIIGILLIFMLIAISIVSAVNVKNQNKAESPLYKIRTKRVVEKKLISIKINFVKNRIFFRPFKFLIDKEAPHITYILENKGLSLCAHTCWTCRYVGGICDGDPK